MWQKMIRWRWITLLGGALLMLVSLTVVAATSMQYDSDSYPDTGASSDPAILREYQNRNLPVRFYYPTTWQPTPENTGVDVYPSAGEADFIRQGALFGVYRVVGNDTPPLPSLVETAIATADTKRTAENVAIGGMSGTEITKELELNGSVSSSVDSQVILALEAVQSDHLTVVVWNATVDNQHYWVIMADARGGTHLATLEQMRDTIQWK